MDVKIKKTMCRTVIFWVILAIILPIISFHAMAETSDNKTVAVSLGRFLAEEMRAENATLEVNADMSVKVRIDGKSPVVSMKLLPFETKTKANALRIVLKNDSSCNGMKIDYIYKNSAQISESASLEEIYVKQVADATEYIVFATSVDTITQLTVRFFGASGGEIDIVSIGMVSAFYDNREYLGELAENTYDRENGRATFAGSVSYEILLQHPDAKIVLYRLAQTEVIEDVRFVHPYVKSCPMTLNYKFEFDIENTSEYCSRYFAAILTEDNKIIPLTSETYLKEKREGPSVGGSDKSSVGFKGIETDLYAGAVENGTSVAFVDVLLNKMGNESGDGYQYILDGKEYYFDRAYLLELDEEIASLSAAGISIYLRFLLDEAISEFGHFNKYITPDKTKYFAINPQNDETVNNIFAYTDFICSRYAGSANSTLRGIIIGRSLDEALEYNYCGSVSMNNYADMLAKTYSIIRIALDRSGDDLEIIVPLSDDEIGAEVILTAKSREENYPADILVRSFLSSLARYGSDFSSMYFMLESDGKPNVWTGTTSIVENMTADDCDDFINMVNNLSKKYEELSDEILFCWFPSSNLSAHELIDIYTYNYNFLACTSGVRNYVISLFEREETVEVGGAVSVAENYMLSTLKSTYKYIDTNNNEKVSASVLESMKKDSWKEMIEGYSSEKTVKRILFENDVVYSLPDGTVGSYKMWDFSFANGTGGWTKSDGCVSLSVYTRSDFESRALTAVLQLGTEKINGADFGSILYHAPESLLMRDISAVSFDVLIPSGTYGDLFEIIVTVGSDIAVSESTGIVKSGETTSIYADISALERVQYIKIGIRALDGAAESTVDMCINSISIHSQKYNSEELENIVLSGEIIDKTEGSKTDTDEKKDNITVAVVLAVSVAVVALLWGWYSVTQKKQNG